MDEDRCEDDGAFTERQQAFLFEIDALRQRCQEEPTQSANLAGPFHGLWELLAAVREDLAVNGQRPISSALPLRYGGAA